MGRRKNESSENTSDAHHLLTDTHPALGTDLGLLGNCPQFIYWT